MEELRVRIKQWENSFQERYHRKPKEEDINDKPDILSLYRRYQKLEKRVESEDTSRTRCSSTSSRIRGRSISNNCIKDVVYQEVANHVRKPSPEPRKKPKPRRTSSLGGSFSGAAPHASLVIRPVVANTNVSLVFERPRTPPGEPLLEAHDEPSIFILPAESSNEDFDENTTPAKRKKPPTSRKRPAKRDNNVRLDLNKKYTKKAKTKSLDRIVKNKWVPRAQWIRQQQVAESEKRNDEAYEELLEPENVDIEVPPTLEFEEVNQTALLKVLSDHFHYNSFREGQEQAIINVVKGISTLLVVPTGWGKSMCYQIPALITAGLTLVVSPLLSLIQDQLESLPPSLPGAQWTSSQSFQEVQDTLKAIRESRIKILFVSPERLFASGFLSAMAGIKLSCLVVDEGHLISQWSHNFRPCYIRIHRVLKKLKVSCVLALTATATVQTRESICNQLGIAADNVICPHIPRSNLKLTVSQDHSPREALVPLLRSQNFEYLDSIIIYVSTKAAADQIANNLKVQGFERVASYHAGKRMDDRRSIQEQFMANELRIVVATVAFGMGLDKQDVRAVIHVNIPRSLEAYVQEVGRAGRDGLPAYCHAFFNQEDISRYRSQVHSDGLDACTIKSLLEKFVFRDSGKHLCVAVSKLASKWDVRTPVVETILVRLEALGYITILANMHGRCSVSFHESLPEKLAEKCNLIKWIIRQLSCRQGRYYVNLDDAANALSAPITAVYRQLLDLRVCLLLIVMSYHFRSDKAR